MDKNRKKILGELRGYRDYLLWEAPPEEINQRELDSVFRLIDLLDPVTRRQNIIKELKNTVCFNADGIQGKTIFFISPDDLS